MRFKGSGGGGPSNVASNLFSTDAFEFVLGIAQGQIGGIVGDTAEEKLKHIYLDDTPIFDSTGNSNFEESELLIRFESGTPLTAAESEDGQTPIWYLFGGATSNQSVSQEINYQAPIVKTTPNIADGWHSLDVQLVISALYRNTDDGVKSNEVDLTVQIEQIGGGHSESKSITVKGKTPQSGFARSVKFELPEQASSSDTYQITVSKLTSDSTDQDINTVIWRGYELVTRKTSNYTNALKEFNSPNEFEYHPSTSMMHVVGVLGDQLSGIPTMNADYEGLLCRVPSNYDPVLKTYDETSAWDGAYSPTRFPTDNPFWIVNELILNEDFGVISYNPNVKVNKYSVYDRAKYADGYNPFTGNKDLQNPNTLETQVSRYTFNAVLKDRMSGMEFINQILATTFSVVLENDDGEIEILTDMPTVPVSFITPEMAISTGSESPFSYSYSSTSERINAVSTSFIDKDSEYATQQLPELRDQDSIDRHGLNVTEFTSLGTTNAWEAERKALVFLVAGQTETESINMLLPLSGIQFQVYDVVAVVDPVMGHAASGRVIAHDTSSLTVRDPLYFAEAGLYRLTLQGITENFDATITIEENEVGLPLTQFSLSRPYPDASSLGDYPVVYIENNTDATTQLGFPKLYRITQIEPTDDTGIEAFAVSAVEFNSQKHTEADLLNQATQPQYSFEKLTPLKKVTGLVVIDESIVDTKQGTQVSAWLSWDEQSGSQIGTFYTIEVFSNGTPKGDVVTTTGNFAELKGLEFSEYEFKVTAERNGAKSAIASVTYEVGRVTAADLISSAATPIIYGSFQNGILTVNADINYVVGTSASLPVPLLAAKYLSTVTFSVFDDSTGTNELLFSIVQDTPHLTLTASQFREASKQLFLPSKLIVRVAFHDSFNDRYPALASEDASLTLDSALALITDVVVTEQSSTFGKYQIVWTDDSPNYEFKLRTSTGNILKEQKLTTARVDLETLAAGSYTFSIQPIATNLKYGKLFTQVLVVESKNTSKTAPVVISKEGRVVVTPPPVDSKFDTYEYLTHTEDVFADAEFSGSNTSLTFSNAIAEQNYYIWYRLVTENNANTTWERTSALGTEQILYTWTAYAEDAIGTNISTEEGELTWQGISSGHTTSESVITDPSIYTWVPLTEGESIQMVLLSDTGNFFRNNTGAVKSISANIFINGLVPEDTSAYRYKWTNEGQVVYVTSSGDYVALAPSNTLFAADGEDPEGLNFKTIKVDFTDVANGADLNLTCTVTNI